ncbi:PGN_0703 family putative restriction endonuclease [Granulicella mallensis]|uniref:PGN_0703 family putative restriction endonuclease n=1 Tax=Granulicella mallensis TaxID=940614 RepID=UPI0037C18C96
MGLNDEYQHGNFYPPSHREIANHPQWERRLRKVHAAFKRARVRANWDWKELDCAHSSDALPMNIFCHPGVLISERAQARASTRLG